MNQQEQKGLLTKPILSVISGGMKSLLATMCMIKDGEFAEAFNIHCVYREQIKNERNVANQYIEDMGQRLREVKLDLRKSEGYLHSLILTHAISYAHKWGIKDIVCGMDETDIIKSMRKDYDINIHTPMHKKSKAEQFKIAKELNILDLVNYHSISDENGDLTMNEWGRGKLDNESSKLRKAGYDEALKKEWI